MYKNQDNKYSKGIMRNLGKIPFVKEGLVALALSSAPLLTGCATTRYIEDTSVQNKIKELEKIREENAVCFKCPTGCSEDTDWEKIIPYIALGAIFIGGAVYLISASGGGGGGLVGGVKGGAGTSAAGGL